MNTDALSLLTTGLAPQRASLPGGDGAAADLAGFAALLMGMVPGAVPQAPQAWPSAMSFGQNDAASPAATGESAAARLGAGFPSVGSPSAGFLGPEARGAAPLLPAGMDIGGPRSAEMPAVPFQRAADLLRAPLSAAGMLRPSQPALSRPSAALLQLLGQMTPVAAAEPEPIRVTPGQASPQPDSSVPVRLIPPIEGDAVAALAPATSLLSTQPLAGAGLLSTQPLAGASLSATAMPDDLPSVLPGASPSLAGLAAFPTGDTPPAAGALATVPDAARPIAWPSPPVSPMTAPAAPAPSVSLWPPSALAPGLAPLTPLTAPAAPSLPAAPTGLPATVTQQLAAAPTSSSPTVRPSSAAPAPVLDLSITLDARSVEPVTVQTTSTDAAVAPVTAPPAAPLMAQTALAAAPLMAQTALAAAPPRASAATVAVEKPERRPSAGDQVSTLAKPNEAPLAAEPALVVEATPADPNGNPGDRGKDPAGDGPATPLIATNAPSFGQLLPTGSDELSSPPLERTSAVSASTEPMPRGQSYPAEPAAPVVQVSTAIAKAANGAIERVHVALEPKELGSIDITISVNSADETKAVIRVEKQETLELLQRDHRQLERLIGNAGLKLESGGLELGLQRDQGQGSAFGQSSPREGRHAFDLQGVEPVKGEAPVRPKPGLKLLDVLI